MKEKIIETLKLKFNTEFELEDSLFLTKEEFETSLNDVVINWKNITEEYKDIYNTLYTSKDITEFKKLLKFSIEEFIDNDLDLIKSFYPNVYRVSYEQAENLYESIVNTRFEDEKMKQLYKANNPNRNFYHYSYRISEHFWILQLYEFIEQQIISQNTSAKEVLVVKLLLRFLHDKTKLEETITNGIPESIIERLRESYFERNKEILELWETSVKSINKENIEPFIFWQLNLGKRSFSSSYNKLNNTFEVTNNKIKYTYTHTNNCEKIEGLFVNLFYLSNGSLVKLNIGANGVSKKTPFIVSKDIQRIDLKNGNIIEFYMHKHFDSETIIFDKEETAYNFQIKVTEMRKNTGNNQWRK